MNRYQSYKQSGVEWIGEIPERWNSEPLKYYFDYTKGSNGQKLTKTYIDENPGIYPVYSGMTENDGVLGFVNEFEFDYSFPLIFTTTVGSRSMTTKILNGKFSLSQNCLVMIRKKECNISFIQYFLSFDFPFRKSLLPTIFQPSLRMEDLDQYKIIIPPLQEQLQIVNYLDEKIELVDKLISTKERKIILLKEQRISLINQIVTKGLNPNVKTKDCGVEWIGVIPENWKIGKLKHHSELNISSVDKHIFDDEISVEVCNYTDVYYNELISNSLELRNGSCTSIEYNKFLLKKGDVIITKDSESPSDIGVPSLVIDELDNVVCGYHLSIIKSNLDSLLGGYLFRQLQTTRVRRYFEVNSNGITRFGLGKSSVLELPLILPPIKEQIEIVKYLDSKTKEIDDLVQLEQKKIDLLKEYRQSLISEVVTGKVKVTQ
jgi:type I restriction enzyme, S subunit